MGLDYLYKHVVVHDFTEPPVMLRNTTAASAIYAKVTTVLPIYEAEWNIGGKGEPKSMHCCGNRTAGDKCSSIDTNCT